MNEETQGRSPSVVAWYRALYEESALLDDPEGYTALLLAQAEALYVAGEVDAAERRDMRESIDAAYASAVEELLTRELHQR